MAEEHYEFTVAIPPGTTPANPLITPTTFQTRIVRGVHWTIPTGATGFVGFSIGMRGVQLIPRNPGAWLIRSGSSGALAADRMPDSGDWSVTGYNTGVYAHSVYVTFEVDVIRPAPPRLILASNSALSRTPPFDAPLWGLDATL